MTLFCLKAEFSYICRTFTTFVISKTIYNKTLTNDEEGIGQASRQAVQVPQ